MAQGPRGSLEDSFDEVGVPAMVTHDVEIEGAVGGDRAPELFGGRRVKCSERLGGQIGFPHAVGAATEIDRRGQEHFVHRNRRRAVSADPRFVPERLAEALPRQILVSLTVWWASVSFRSLIPNP